MKLHKLDPKLVDKVINVAYGDASIIEKIIVRWKATHNYEVKRLLKEYESTARLVHNLELEEVPENFIKNVQRNTGTSIYPKSIFEKLQFALFSRPILSSAVTGTIALLVITLLVFKQPSPAHNYTDAEIELAQKQLGESIAIVNKVFQKTTTKIDKEVIPNHVSKPLNKGLNLINDYLAGG